MCRCKYPYRTRVGDDAKGHRLLFCINHGFMLMAIAQKFQPKRPVLRKLPTKVYIEQEAVRTERRFKKSGI